MTYEELKASTQRQKARLVDAIANLQHAKLEADAQGNGCTRNLCEDAIAKAEQALRLAGL